MTADRVVFSVGVAHGRSAADALHMLSTGCYNPAPLDAVLEDVQAECLAPLIAQRIAASRMRYALHERSVAGIRHGSEEHRAWIAERKQVFHELRVALTGVLGRDVR